MPSTMIGRLALVGTLSAVLAVLLVASPAFGGPNAFELAKRALSVGKHAREEALTARRQVRAAKADILKVRKIARQARSLASFDPRTVVVDSGPVTAAPSGFARFDVDCPPSYAPTGPSISLGGLDLVAAVATPDGYVGAYANPSTTDTFTGSLGVVCIQALRPGATARTASTPALRLPAARAKVRHSMADYLAAHSR